MRTSRILAAMIGVVGMAGLALWQSRSASHETVGISPKPTEEPAISSPLPRQSVPAPLALLRAAASTTPPAVASAQATSVPQSTIDELRSPIVNAIRASYPTPALKREGILRALEKSGTSREPFTKEAASVFESWRTAMPSTAADRLRPRDLRCYRAGCAIEVRFADNATYEEASDAIRRGAPADARHGGRIQSPPEVQSNGELVATWIMLRPDTEAEAAIP